MAERMSTHFQGCWRVNGHHACAIHLLDLILRDAWLSAPTKPAAAFDEAKAWAWPAECDDADG